jgi:type III secretion protein O
MTMLDELLRLKVYRQEKAEMGLARCRFALAEVARRAGESREALTGYQRWSAEHELGLFGALYGRLVRARDLEYLREDVVVLRLKERTLQESLDTVEVEQGQAEVAVRESRAVHEQASRTREKFVQLVSLQSEEIRLETERREDIEMEDLYTIRRDREDWEGGEDE